MLQRTNNVTIVFMVCLMCTLSISSAVYGLCENEKREIKALDGMVSLEKIQRAKVQQQLNIAQKEVRTLHEKLALYSDIETRLYITASIGIVTTVAMFLFGIALGSKARKDSQTFAEKEHTHE